MAKKERVAVVKGGTNTHFFDIGDLVVIVGRYRGRYICEGSPMFFGMPYLVQHIMFKHVEVIGTL